MKKCEDMISIEYFLLVASILILISIGIAKVFDNLGIPTLILFIGIGMLAGSEGLGGIEFDNAVIAQNAGILALVFILFAGGLGTNWKSVKPVLRDALSLATIGVLLTAVIVGVFTYFILGLSLLSSILVGAIISSTDAAAVFAVLGTKNVSLKNQLKPLLELESGSNDPMAVFLTIGFIQLIIKPETSFLQLAELFLLQMGIGAAAGFLLGKAAVIIVNSVRIQYQGVYSVLMLAIACLTYSLTALLGGSGFLAVYIAGIMVGNHEFVHKKSLGRFFDGMAWLSQISIFLILGLLVFPSEVIVVSGNGLLLSFILIFVARPVSVFISLAFSRFSWREKMFISWVGLRGAVPIILATFPLIYGVPNAALYFSLVFFIVLTSALLQGWTLNMAAGLFRVRAPIIKQTVSPIEFAPVEGVNAELIDFYIHEKSENSGRTIVGLGLPPDSLVVIINRNENYIVPSGGTTIEPGDILLTLVSNENIEKVKKVFSR